MNIALSPKKSPAENFECEIPKKLYGSMVNLQEISFKSFYSLEDFWWNDE